MAKISTYPSADVPLQLSDRLIGTEAIRPVPSPTPLATKNFSLGELLQLFSSNFPAASLQAVLDTGNTATQNITLVGTIDATLIKPDNIEDTSGSQGTTFQFLSKGTSSINWVDLPISNLQSVLDQGNSATQDINLAGTIYSTLISPNNIQDEKPSLGNLGQVLTKSATGIVWADNPFATTPGLADVLSVGNTATNDINLIGNVTATSFIKSGGTNLQYLMADGSVTTGGGSQNLQQVTDAGNTTTNSIILDNTEPYGDYLSTNTLGSLYSNYTLNSPTTGHSFNADYGSEGIYLTSIEDATVNNIDINDSEITVTYHDGVNIGAVTLDAGVADNLGGYIRLARLNAYGAIRISSLTNNIQLEFPNKAAGTYTIATTDDIPTIGTWGALNYPIWSSGTPFVKMTAVGTFALDTNTYLTTAVTSIGITVPPAFSVTPSSITTSGTFAITGAGTASQYIRGDGQLATFPTSGGGGSSVFYYLNGSVAASVATYKQMSNAAVIGTGTDFSLTGNGLIAQFLTDAGNPNRLEIPGGAWNFEMFFSMSSSGGTPKFYVELLKYDGAVFTSIANGSLAPETISGGTTLDLYLSSLAVPTTTLLLTDRLAVRVYIVNNSGGRTATLHTEDGHLCQIITTFSSGISAINGLTSNNQYLAVGTSGTDFNINSALETHTFNLPSASETARGLVTINGQTFAGAKTFSTAPILSSLTASQLLALDASKNVQSLDTATYPSLTELSYVKGVTSPIQTQLNSSVKTLILDSTKIITTGTIGNTLMSSYLIPANTIKPTDKIINLNSLMVTKEGASATWALKFYRNSISSLTGAVPLTGTISSALTAVFSNVQRTYFLEDSNLKCLNISGGGYTDYISSTVAFSSIPFDITIDQYIIVMVIPTLATNVFTQQGINLTFQ
jgi:hypothetical protein